MKYTGLYRRMVQPHCLTNVVFCGNNWGSPFLSGFPWASSPLAFRFSCFCTSYGKTINWTENSLCTDPLSSQEKSEKGEGVAICSQAMNWTELNRSFILGELVYLLLLLSYLTLGKRLNRDSYTPPPNLNLIGDSLEMCHPNNGEMKCKLLRICAI